MKKRSKKVVQTKKQLLVPFWMVDGFIGILALVIYNFLLFLINSAGINGVIEQMQNTTGYFLLNSFADFGFSASQIVLGLLIVFVISFCLGIFIGNLVRKRKKRL